MSALPPPTPQETPLYRLIAALTQFQLGSVLRRAKNPRLIVMLFVFITGKVVRLRIEMKNAKLYAFKFEN